VNPSFRVSVVGPSRVGKTTLLTAVLSDTHDLLAGTPVTVSMDEPTEARVRRQQKDLRWALELGEFDAAALGGTQEINRYHVALHPNGDESVQIPFDLLDYPGGWLDLDERNKNPHAVAEWPNYLNHVRESIMLLVPIDAAVLMEAHTPLQKAAVGELLGLMDVENVGMRWAKGRLENANEPAVVVLAPLKCEKYFGDNGGYGKDEAKLRGRVREKYGRLLEVVAKETADRGGAVRVVYAPIDTYGCVELMEARWKSVNGQSMPEFEAHFRFRGRPPQIRVRAAGTIMQELCRSVLAGQTKVEAEAHRAQQGAYNSGIARKAEAKGFWGTLGYHLSGEAGTVNWGIKASSEELARITRRQGQLRKAAEKLASVPYDRRVEIWNGENGR
jgi:hypothetical protein